MTGFPGGGALAGTVGEVPGADGVVLPSPEVFAVPIAFFAIRAGGTGVPGGTSCAAVNAARSSSPSRGRLVWSPLMQRATSS